MASDEFFRLVRDWVTIHLPLTRRLSPHTIRSYKTALRTLIEYLRQTQGLTLSQIGFEAVTRSNTNGFLAWMIEHGGLAPASANQRLAGVKSFLSYCAGEDPGLVAVWLDVKQVHPARTPQRKPDPLTMPQVEALIRAPRQDTPLGRRDTTIILTMFDTAARVQELLDLVCSDVDTTPGAARVWLTGKGRKTRAVPIMDKTGRHIARHLAEFHPGSPDPAAPLFRPIYGQPRPMSQDAIAYLLRKHADQARPNCPDMPPKIHAHQLRHARATQMLRAGVPLTHIKEFLGHTDIATTMIYATADNQMVREALQKAASPAPGALAPTWQGDDDLILQLAALK